MLSEILSFSLYLIYRLTIFPSSQPALHYRNMIRWIVFMSFSCSWMECTNRVYFRVLLVPFFSLEGAYSWLCFIHRWTFDLAATWLLPHCRMHRRSYCNLLWQTNWLPAHKKQKRKGKECALSILRCSRVNFMGEMFSSEKSLNIKVGYKQSKVKLATLPSSNKMPIYESFFNVFFKVLPP